MSVVRLIVSAFWRPRIRRLRRGDRRLRRRRHPTDDPPAADADRDAGGAAPS
ncbi:hypothetical protein BN2537_3625 [Streptomyces venezuelae]|nr:hypothetical protein BN2537_3625 [Streptomyces venezuelae]